ncbi:flagellar biosynthesis protein FlgA [Cellulomonas sp. IC4_254]|nr:flagellar biosynthesis protein FlgA [Cellulomonas sp. IC4_254]
MLTWRARRPLAALCAGLAALVAVGLLRPADPPTARVPVAARDLALGAVLAAGDVRLTDVPLALVPAHLVDPDPDPGATRGRAAPDDAGPGGSAVEALVGRRLAVAVPAGLPLVVGLLVDDAAAGPPGTVVVPVRFADAGVADVLTPGMRVDVVAAALHDGDEATRLARAAVVLARPGADAGTGSSGSGGGLLGGGATASESAPVLLAVDPEESVALSGAAASRVLSAVIVG